ncbi:NUDIX hydrolase [Marinovum sp.]|uniref:NUDIX hydrolase n=1 Tax=Marinovum sp. TaxID=2024839 RepID=UPI003A8F0284
MTEGDGIARQIAALPIRWDKTGKLRILMVTSRDRGRWVMPKGWLMDGKKPWRAAEIEALEEAGALGFVSKRTIGTYDYDKLLADGTSLRCRVTLYPMVVSKLKRRWKERSERKRHWFAPKKAAKLVEEEELSQLLTELAEKPQRRAVIEKLRKAA